MDKPKAIKEYDYEERIFSGWLTVILGIATCVLFGVFIYQRLMGPVGTRPAPDLILLVVALLLLFVMINFATLTIRLTTGHFRWLRYHQAPGRLEQCC